MDEKLPEKDGHVLEAHKQEEEEMEVTMTTQLENLNVTPDGADTSTSQAHPEETGDAHTDSKAAVHSLDGVCRTEVCEDSSDGSDRYLPWHTAVWQEPSYWSMNL